MKKDGNIKNNSSPEQIWENFPQYLAPVELDGQKKEELWKNIQLKLEELREQEVGSAGPVRRGETSSKYSIFSIFSVRFGLLLPIAAAVLLAISGILEKTPHPQNSTQIGSSPSGERSSRGKGGLAVTSPDSEVGNRAVASGSSAGGSSSDSEVGKRAVASGSSAERSVSSKRSVFPNTSKLSEQREKSSAELSPNSDREDKNSEPGEERGLEREFVRDPNFYSEMQLWEELEILENLEVLEKLPELINKKG